MPTLREYLQQYIQELELAEQLPGQGMLGQLGARLPAALSSIAELPYKALGVEPTKTAYPVKVPQTMGEKIGAFGAEVLPEIGLETAFLAGTGGVAAAPLAMQTIGSAVAGGVGGAAQAGASGAAIGATLGAAFPVALGKLMGKFGRKGVEELSKLSDADLSSVRSRVLSWQQQFIEQTGRAPTDDEIAEIYGREAGRQMTLRGVELPTDYNPTTGTIEPSGETRQILNLVEGKVPAQLPPGDVRFITLYESASTGNTPAFRQAAAMAGQSADEIDRAVKVLTASKRGPKGRFIGLKTVERGARFREYLDEAMGGRPASNVPNVDVEIAGINAALRRTKEVPAGVEKFVREGVERAPGELEVVAERVARRRPFVKFKGAKQKGYFPSAMLPFDTALSKAFNAAGVPASVRKSMTGLAPPIEGLPVLTPTERILLGKQYDDAAEVAVGKIKNMVKNLAPEESSGHSGIDALRRAQKSPSTISDNTIETFVKNSPADRSSLTGEEGFLLIGRVAEHLRPGAKEHAEQLMKRWAGQRKNILTVFYNGMLLWPPTILRNFIGNNVETALQILERGTRAGISLNPGQIRAQFSGAGHGLINAWASAGEAWRTGMIKAIREGGDEFGEVMVTPWAKMGPASKILSWMDDFYTTLAYHMDLEDRIYRQAYRTGKKGQALVDEIVTLNKNVPKELSDKSMTQARRVVFRDVAYGKYEEGMTAFSRGLHNRAPVLGRMAVPFGPTLIRIGKRSLEYSPLNYLAALNNTVVKSFVRGLPMDTEQGMLGAIRATYGTVAISGLAYLAHNGMINGAMDHLTTSEKETQRAAGIEPYSFKWGDQWISYRNLGPISAAFQAAANTVETGKKTGNIFEAIKSFPTHMMKAAMDATWLPGFMDIVNGMLQPEKFDKKMWKQLLSYLQPVSAVAGIARAVDPTIREIDPTSPREVFKSRVPTETKELRPKLGLFGEELKRTPTPTGGIVEQAELAVSPLRRKKLTTDPIVAEVARVQAPLTSPSIELDIESLTDEDKWTASKAMGMLQKKYVTRVINTPFYRGLDDEQKRKILANVHGKARTAINNMIKALVAQGKAITYRGLLKDLIAE